MLWMLRTEAGEEDRIDDDEEERWEKGDDGWRTRRSCCGCDGRRRRGEIGEGRTRLTGDMFRLAGLRCWDMGSWIWRRGWVRVGKGWV